MLTRAEGSFLAATEAVNEVDADESTGKKGEKVGKKVNEELDWNTYGQFMTYLLDRLHLSKPLEEEDNAMRQILEQARLRSSVCYDFRYGAGAQRRSLAQIHRLAEVSEAALSEPDWGLSNTWQMSLGTALAQEANAPEEAEAGGESDPLLLSRCNKVSNLHRFANKVAGRRVRDTLITWFEKWRFETARLTHADQLFNTSDRVRRILRPTRTVAASCSDMQRPSANNTTDLVTISVPRTPQWLPYLPRASLPSSAPHMFPYAKMSPSPLLALASTHSIPD